MAHGFGNTPQVMKGIFGAGKKELGSMTSNAYDAGMNFIGKMDGNFMDGIRRRQDEVANPHMYKSSVTNDYGRSVPGKHMGSSVTDDFGNSVSNGMKPNSWMTQKKNIMMDSAKGAGKGFAIGGIMSGGLYGLSAYMTDNSDNSAGDRMAHYGKHAIAAGVDMGSDLALTGLGIGLATLGGPAGVIAGSALMAFNMFAGFAGMDAGSLAMTAMNYADEQYDIAKQGPKFNMTQNTSQSMQRQIQNLHASGSNLGEMMHN